MILGDINNNSKNYTRIISAVPSLTELLSDLDLDDKIIGITKFCVHPDYLLKIKSRIGGTKNLNIEQIKSLKPDLIVANKEENTREQIEDLAQFTDVYLSDISNYNEAINMIRDVGQLTDCIQKSNLLIHELSKKYEQLKISIKNKHRIKSVYLIWKDPYMAVGGDTFISNMMNIGGFNNLTSDLRRYPELTIDDIKSLAPEAVLLSSEPYPFKEAHIKEMMKLLPDCQFFIVDGEMFSWYGSRMVHTLTYLHNLNQDISSII